MDFTVQFNTANAVDGNDALNREITESVRSKLSRFEPRLTRLEIHFSDENGPRSSSDELRCMIEARPKGGDAVSVTGEGTNLQQAANVATGKMISLLDSRFGKLDRVRP